MKYQISFIIIYLLLQTLLSTGGYYYYRSFLRRAYLKEKELSFFTGFSQLLIFLSHGIILHLPYYVYTSWPEITTGQLQCSIGFTSGIFALFIVIFGFFNLGPFSRTMGINSKKLTTHGLYRFSRNPQVLAYGLFLVSYAIVWPSWYIVPSLISYGVIVHRMVLTEELHLRNIFGEAYKEYCIETPRYIFEFKDRKKSPPENGNYNI